MAKVSIKLGSITLKAGTERTFRATWTATGSQCNHIDKYEYRWLYKTSNESKKSWISGSSGTVDGDASKSDAKNVIKESTFDAPNEATQLTFQVRATAKSHKVKVKEKNSKGKLVTKEKEKKYFSTTHWTSKKKATKVNKQVFTGYVAIVEKYSFTPGTQYPLSINVTPYRSDDKEESEDEWLESFDVTWEFYVDHGGQKTWETGDSSGTHVPTERTIYYTGTLPESFEQLRVVTKPTSLQANVIAQNKERYWSGITQSKVPRTPTAVKISKFPHGDNTLIAEWALANDSALEGFTCVFESLTEGSKYWGNSTSMDIDPDQYLEGKSYSDTITIGSKYNPTKAELDAEKIVNKGREKGIKYILNKGIKKNEIEATAYYDQLENTVRVMRVKRDNIAVQYAAPKTVTTKNNKYWYSDEYTIPTGATNVRVTITPKSTETSGWLDRSAQATYKITPNNLAVPKSSVKFSIKPGTRRTVIAQWTGIKNSNIESYEYKWGYKISGSNIEFTDGSTGSISADATSLYAEYEASDNAKTVIFYVRPIPKHANDFVGAWSSPASYSIPGLKPKEIDYSSIKIVWPEEGRTDKTLYASWSLNKGWPTEDRNKLAGYEVMWRYKMSVPGLGTFYQEGETQTINDPAILTDSYTAPTNAKLAEFRIRPVPKEEWDFEGIWSEYKIYPFAIETRTINAGSLKVVYSTGTDRKLKVSFTMGDMRYVSGFRYRYQTYARGVLSKTTEEDLEITQNPFEFDAPSDAEKIFVNVKPLDESGNDVNFKGEYLGTDVEYSLTPGTRAVSDIEMELQRGSKTTVVARWSIDDVTDLDSYSYKWRYQIDRDWIDAQSGSTSAISPVCTYDPPAQADAVEIRVTPVATYSLAFAGKESEPVIFTMPSSTIPDTPAVPSLSVNKFMLTATVDSYDEKASAIEFEIIDGINTEDTDTGTAELLFNRATFMLEGEAGYGYRVRARALNDDGEYSDWSEYSSDPVYTIPLPPEGVPEVNALSATSVEILWAEVTGASSYVIQRTTKSRYFDAAPDLVEETTIERGTRAEIQGLTPKSETDPNDGQWFFRIKAVNDNSGSSEWSEIASIVLGTVPDAPTTWSSSTTPVTSDDVYLNWLHNSEDGSAQSGAIVEMTVNGVKESHEIVDEYELFEPYIYETSVDFSNDVHIPMKTVTKDVYTYTSDSISIDISDVPEERRSNLEVDCSYPYGIVLKNEKLETWETTNPVVLSNGLEKGSTVTLYTTGIPRLLNDSEHMVIHIIRNSDGSSLDDYVESFSVTASTATILIKDYSGDPITDPVTVSATAQAYTDNYEIDGDTLIHYIYTVSSTPSGDSSESATMNVWFLVEKSIDISSIPSIIRSLDYGGITKLGDGNGTDTRNLRIEGNTLYFSVGYLVKYAGNIVPITLSFYKDDVIITEPTEMTHTSVKVESAPKKINNYGGTQFISVDISDIPKNQRDGLLVESYLELNPDNKTVLKNENLNSWRYTSSRTGLPKGEALQIALDNTMLPDGIRDLEHNMTVEIADLNGNSYTDTIDSWTFANDILTIQLLNYDGEEISGDVNVIVSVSAYTDNYEIDGDTLTHYVYDVTKPNVSPAVALSYILSVSKDDIYHRSLANNFSFQRGGVSYYLIPAGTYDAGAVITWKVKTKGVLPDYGPFSAERQVNIYTPPTVRFTIGSGYQWISDDFEFRDDNLYPEDAIEATSINGILETFPMILSVHSGPTTQKPLVYVITIISDDTYEDVDDSGRIMFVRSGQEVYKRYIYTSERDFVTLISANELNVDNNHSYTMTITVNTDAGLTGEASSTFVVEWELETDIELDTTIMIDEDTAAAYLSPSCTNEEGYFLNNISLSVYRRDFDGGLTEIASDLRNGEGITVTDPHPALDYARYRIVATDLSTGRMFYEDLAPQPVGIPEIIIQWDEAWTGFEADFPQLLEEAPYKGSVLRLPYNIDESEQNDLDVELVNYIGRRHPVSYFGTHVGQTASWKSDIDKTDVETIYALRRLAVWPGDCYVRAPSGIGYWAHVKVNFDISHLNPIVPVSLDITRVEGGI